MNCLTQFGINFLKLQIKVMHFIRIWLKKYVYYLSNTKKDRMIVPFFLTCIDKTLASHSK